MCLSRVSKIISSSMTVIMVASRYRLKVYNAHSLTKKAVAKFLARPGLTR